MKTTLITGGAGFIGSHVARALAAQQQQVILLDNFDDYYDAALKRARAEALAASPYINVIEADIRDAAAMDSVVAEYSVRRILNLAAMGNVRYSIERAPLYVAVNVNGTVNLLEAARKHSVELFITASTSAVYGQTAQVPFVETDPADRPLASYPATKRASELMAHTYTNLFNLPVTVLRFFNVYGPDGRPDMMPMRVMKAILHDQEIPLFNGGQMQRDWTYIDDIVQGVLTALERPLGYEIINLGYGTPVSMVEFIKIMERLTGKRAIVKDVPAPSSDASITYADNGKARRLLDFAPRTPLAEGLAHTWAWYKQVYLSAAASPLAVLPGISGDAG